AAAARSTTRSRVMERGCPGGSQRSVQICRPARSVRRPSGAVNAEGRQRLDSNQMLTDLPSSLTQGAAGEEENVVPALAVKRIRRVQTAHVDLRRRGVDESQSAQRNA